MVKYTIIKNKMLKLEKITIKSLEGKKILEDVNIKFEKNTYNLILGPNGSGKTTFAKMICGFENFKIKGKIYLGKKEITKLKLYQRAKLGIFLSYQNPIEIPGVKTIDFLFSAYTSIYKKNINIWEFNEKVLKHLKKLKLEETFLERNINEEFSGGEKKKFEILQILILKPKVVILDEIDSGLDIDSVKNIFKIVKEYKEEKKALVILITHNSKILKYIDPNKVVLIEKKKVFEGNISLAKKILKEGYET